MVPTSRIRSGLSLSRTSRFVVLPRPVSRPTSGLSQPPGPIGNRNRATARVGDGRAREARRQDRGGGTAQQRSAIAQHQSTATMTSLALMMAQAVWPLASLSSSIASLVIEAVMTGPPISIFTCDVVTPLVTCVTAPLRRLRALIFMAAPVPRMSSNSRNNSKHRVGQNRGNLVGTFSPTADKTLAAGDQKPGKGG